MDQGSTATAWWVLAGLMVIVELMTGSVYLLMMALGMGAAAVVAWLGVPLTAQFVAAALVGGGATTAWHLHVRRTSSQLPAHQDRDVNLDIGERVHVPAWQPGGVARVNYRGSLWQARLAPGAVAEPGLHVVIAVEANWLVLSPLGATAL